MGNLSMLAGAPRDMEIFFDKLYKASPDEIRDDVKTLRDSAKKAGEINPGNIIGGLTSGLMLGLSTKGAEERVNIYTETNCNFPGLAKRTAVTPTITNKPEPNRIFDNNSKGIVAIYDDHNAVTTTVYAYSLVLIDPTNFEIISEYDIPTETWHDPKGIKFNTVAKNSATYARYHKEEYSWDSPRNYGKDLRYVPIQYERESDGSQDVGFLDLSTNTATNISGDTDKSSFGSQTVIDEDPFFNPFDPNMFLFLHNDKRHVYYMDSKKIESYDKETTKMSDETFKSIKEKDYGKSVNKSSRFMLLYDDKARKDEFGITFTNSYDCKNDSYLDKSKSSICSEAAFASFFSCNDSSIWMDEDTYLCLKDNQFFKIKASTAKVVTAEGFEFYAIPPPSGLLPKNDRSNSSPIVSPDGKTILFYSSKGKERAIYSVSADGGEPKLVKTLTTNEFPYHYLFWR
ncbi:MAG: hypothetical protein RI947_782 [Candidatus Parcubacteria bacterium]